MAVNITSEQLQLLNTSITANQQQTAKIFVKFTGEFHGEYDQRTVMMFLTRLNLSKDGFNVSDADALKSLPCVFKSDAITWWDGVMDSVPTRNDVAALIKSSYAPVRPNHRIFLEIFGSSQNSDQPTSEFTAQKRALLAEVAHVSSWTSSSDCSMCRYARE